MTFRVYRPSVAGKILLAASCIIALSGVALAQADLIFSVKETVIDMKGHQATQDVNVALTTRAVVVEHKKRIVNTIPFETISSIVYDRRSRVRVMAPTWNRRQQHFVTIQYKTGDVGEFAEFELGKDAAASFVNTLEARSGKRIERITG